MLAVENVSFEYGRQKALEQISFKIAAGEHLSIIGESGCGKSTLLKIIYGLFDLEQGSVHWQNEPILGPAFNLVPGHPKMKFLSQDFDLMPFTTVYENISKFLSLNEPEKTKARTQELLQLIEMEHFANVKVKNLSGGQQQRVALARVLAQKPEVILLDEPFSHIDNFKKNQLRQNVFGYLKKEGITVLTATHDPNDVLPFSDKTMVIKNHKLLALENTHALYQNPKKLYVAALFGEASLLPVQVIKPYAQTEAQIIVYPYEFMVSKDSGLKVVVKEAYFKGSHYLVRAETENNRAIYFNSSLRPDKNAIVFLNISFETLQKRLAQ